MAQTTGLRTTTQSISVEDRVIRAIDEKIGFLDPDVAPLITLTMRLNKREGVDNPKQEFMEQDYVARWAQNGSATVAATTTAYTIALATGHGAYFVIGDVAMVVPAVSSGTYSELVRVTNKSTDTITVTRGFAGSTPVSIAPSTTLRILGSAYPEANGVPTSKYSYPATNVTYTQIFRTACPPISYTDVATKKYGSKMDNERKRNQRIKLIEHKQAMNAALLFGKASATISDTGTGATDTGPLRTTQGILSTISTNKFDAGGVLTLKSLGAYIAQSFRYGSTKKLFLVSSKMAQALDQWANSHLTIKMGERVFGIGVKTYYTSHGELMVVRDWMLEDGVSGQNGFSGISLILDMDQISYFYLKGMEGYGDTKLYQDVVKDGTHKYLDEYVTEGGFKIRQEKYHSMIYNITDYAA